jgi:hypothetical protein
MRQNLAIQPIELLRRCPGQSLIEQRLPAEHSHHQFGGKSVIARGKLCQGSGMEQFGGVGFFALDPQTEFRKPRIAQEKRPSQAIVPDGRRIWAGSR